MKDKFSEFYEKPDLERLWEKCTFVFDASVLLNLYTYPKEIHDEFINILENEIPNRIWTPYQIGLEFHRNRVHGIKEAVKNYDGLKSTITNLESDSKNLAQKIMELNNTHFGSEINPDKIKECLGGIDTTLNEMAENLGKKPDYDNDKIRDKLNVLFDGKIGDNYPDSRLKEIYKEGEIRSAARTPPGFKDNEYSDLILWHQILDYAKEEEKNVIFVTDNSKNWWIKHENELIEPHPSLFKEFSAIGREFYVYRLSDFLRGSKKYLNVNIKSKTIEAVAKIEEVNGLSDELKELKRIKNTEIKPLSDSALQEMIDQTMMGENTLQKIINQGTACGTLQKLIDQNAISEGALQKMINQTIMGESALQKLINEGKIDGKALQKLIHQGKIDGNDLQKLIVQTINEKALQKMINETIMGESALPKLINENEEK